MPLRNQNSNKGTFGKVLNFSGANNYIGAAYLSTVSVLKVGAGFVALSSDENVIKSVSTMLPEAVYYSHEEGLKFIQDFSVILLGCGLGTMQSSVDLFRKVLEKRNPSIPIVIDADGLNILADNYYKFDDKAILTPHPKEAARLLGVNLDLVLSDMENSAKRISEKYNCVVVLKSHRTIICYKDDVFVNHHGNSALAKAGTGDVLAGIISGLLAQNVLPFEAAKLGVYLHSRAGEIASQELTEYSVLASDIPKYLHLAIKEIL